MLNAHRKLLRTVQWIRLTELRYISHLPTPKLIPFEISETEAKEKFHKWQHSKWLAPSKLLEAPGVSIRAIYVPFWCFDTQLSFTYSATPVFKTNSNGKLHRGAPISGNLPLQRFKPSSPETQVYASYSHRRDFMEAVKVSNWVEKARKLSPSELDRRCTVSGLGDVSKIAFDGASLRQCISWELALRAITKAQKRDIERRILHKLDATELQEMYLTPKVVTRKASLVYFPTYIVDYGFTRSYSSSGELKQNRFQSVISGTETGQVLGERHYSRRKVQAAASVIGGSIGSTLAMLNGTSFAVETIFWSFLAATTAGMYAQFSTIIDRWNTLHSVELDHQKFTKQYFNDFADNPNGAFSDYQDALRCESEWSQWEELNKWNWKEEERRNWCEALWREQHRRRQSNINFRIKTEQEKIKRQWEQEREERRRRKFGESDRQQTNPSFPWRRNGGGRKDVFGFYALLGLNPEEKVNTAEIKEAFKKEAMRCHPDLHAVHLKTPNGSTLDITKRRQRFQSLQQAYEVLRDPKKKQMYDRGELRRHDL
eukprot:g2320.t1